MINVHKPHNSLLLFSTLVYLVLLAPIDSLVMLPDFDKSPPYFWVGASSLNPWSNSVWVAMLRILQCPPIPSSQEESLTLQGLCLSLPRPSVTHCFTFTQGGLVPSGRLAWLYQLSPILWPFILSSYPCIYLWKLITLPVWTVILSLLDVEHSMITVCRCKGYCP